MLRSLRRGTDAKALFLLEAPGPKAITSGYISRNNPDQTAKHLCELMHGARINRKDTLLWNIVPWYIGDGHRILPVTTSDLSDALPYLQDLLALLPQLQIIVLIGKKAQSAREQVRALTNASVIETHHPSPRVFNTWPEKKRQTQKALLQVEGCLYHSQAQPTLEDDGQLGSVSV